MHKITIEALHLLISSSIQVAFTSSINKGFHRLNKESPLTPPRRLEKMFFFSPFQWQVTLGLARKKAKDGISVRPADLPSQVSA